MFRTTTLTAFVLAASTAFAGPRDFEARVDFSRFDRGPMVHGEVDDLEDRFHGVGDADDVDYEEIGAGDGCTPGTPMAEDCGETVTMGGITCEQCYTFSCETVDGYSSWELTSDFPQTGDCWGASEDDAPSTDGAF